jgi:hypothetical protein
MSVTKERIELKWQYIFGKWEEFFLRGQIYVQHDVEMHLP